MLCLPPAEGRQGLGDWEGKEMHVWLPKGYPQPETMYTSLEHTYGSLKEIYYPPPLPPGNGDSDGDGDGDISPDDMSASHEHHGQGLGPGPGVGDHHRIDNNSVQTPTQRLELDLPPTVDPLVAMSTQGWTDRQQYLFKQAQATRYLEGGDLHANLSRKTSNLAYSTKSLQGARALKVNQSPLLMPIPYINIYYPLDPYTIQFTRALS